MRSKGRDAAATGGFRVAPRSTRRRTEQARGFRRSRNEQTLEQYMATKIKGGLLLPIFGQPKITLLILTKNPHRPDRRSPADVSGAGHRTRLSPDALLSIRLAGEQLQGLIASHAEAQGFRMPPLGARHRTQGNRTAQPDEPRPNPIRNQHLFHICHRRLQAEHHLIALSRSMPLRSKSVSRSVTTKRCHRS